ncbi:MAG: NAD(P)-dependent oxidoreductase [archaeon]
MKVLVTGSNGFIGRELIKELKKGKKFQVREFDRSQGFDLLDETSLKKALTGIEIVVHLAACLDENNKKLMKKVNVAGTRKLLEACRKTGKIKQFVFVSTLGVFGKTKQKVNEKSKRKPETFYEKTKLKGEKLVENCSEFKTTILRLALIYGPNEYWKNIVRLISNGYPLIGKGKNYWQLLYFKDAVKALKLVLNNEKAFNKSFNVSESEKYAVSEIVEIVRKELKLAGNQKKVNYFIGLLISYFLKMRGKKTLLPEHVKRLNRHRLNDNSKIKKLGWKTEFNLKKGLKEITKSVSK